MNCSVHLKRAYTAIVILVLGATILHSQTRSRILGTIIDSESGEGLWGANVLVLNTMLGAAADEDGKFFIVNVPVGTYDVKISAVGFQAQLIQKVIVSADRVTQLKIELSPQAYESEEVIVTAKADNLHKEVANTQMVATEDQIENAVGIREINSFLQKLPGVSSSDGFLTIRGGSADQVGSMVNGLSYNNASVGNAETSVPLSAIEQVSLLSGGYNAEYGNFRSGLINITTKSGTQAGYHGSFNFSRNNSHIRRFGPEFYDANNVLLRSYLDPAVAFIGTEEAWKDNEYARQQSPRFGGWNSEADKFNRGKLPEQQVSPLDLYLFSAWMFMTEPDYEGLAKMGYTVSDEQKRLFAEHKMKEENYDLNFDGGFGGPVPFIGEYLGDATFYLSNVSTEKAYIMPVTKEKESSYTTLLTMKSTPAEALTVTFNGLWKRIQGVSPIRPPWGDQPNSGDRGGFMPTDNLKYFSKDETYFWDAPFFPLLNQTTLMGGITINHVLSKSTFYEFSASVLSIQNQSPTGDNRDTTWITNFGPIYVDEMPRGKWQYAPSHTVNGYKHISYDGLPGIGYRFRGKEGDLYDNTKTNQYRLKFDIASQLDENNYLKAGVEYNLLDLNHMFWEKWNNNAYNTYEFNFHRKPSQTALYVQDQISYEGIVANVGLRMDYYYGGGGLWPTGDAFNEDMFRPQPVDTSLYRYLASGKSYIWDIWRAYDAENPGFLQPINNWLTFSPRIGLSFPVTENSKFYFNYGHFRSNPPYYTMYQFRYRYDKNGLYSMSNPNLEPPKTISYELGMAYNFYESYLVNISGYYKDVTGQHGYVNYQNETGSIDYDLWENNQYEDIQGLEINVSKNDNTWLTGWINFNYMLKKSGLTGRQVITNVSINNDQEGLYQGNESRFLPRPQLNANITFRTPEEFGPDFLGQHLLGNWYITFFAEWEAGGYFTWNPLDERHLSNNLQWPDYYMLDLKISKTVKFAGLSTTFFIDVSNLLNIKNNRLSKGYAFDDDVDRTKYFASLHLPMYNSEDFDLLRQKNPGFYIGGDDKVGELRSEEKDYINDPNYPFWIFGQPRDIWFGARIDF